MRLLLMTFLATLFAFGNITSIEDIKKEYAIITQSLKSYSKITKSLDGFSAEGGEVVIHKDGSNRIKMMQVTYFGEMGKMTNEYYFDDAMQLFFLYKVVENYNSHVATQEFDAKSSTITKERFYLIDTKIVQWIKEDKVLDAQSTNFDEEGQTLYQSLAQLLLALL